jgi:Ca2+-binding RTX toxin-like protein
VATGDGDDSVAILSATNGADWVNEFRVATGAGNDVVVIGPFDVAGAAAAGDATFANTAFGAGAFAPDDAATLSFVDLGAGDDVFIGRGSSRDVVRGGAGDDLFLAGRGDDTLEGGAGHDRFVFGSGDGQDTILDFAPTARGGAAADHLTLRGFGIPALQAILAAAVQDGADTVLHYGEDSVRLVGVGKAELALQDLLF